MSNFVNSNKYLKDNIMLNFISKIFGGSKSDKDVDKIRPLVGQINAHFASYKSITNDELRSKTKEFQGRIKNHLTEIDNNIKSLTDQAEQLPAEDIIGRDDIYKEIDEIKKKRNEKIEEALKEILPEAFAVVKEAGRRFKENDELVSTATALDREFSIKKDYVTINGDQSTFKTSWMAAGNLVNWNMVHYDVQLIGGTVLHNGKIAEILYKGGMQLCINEIFIESVKNSHS
jgi:preprotein translocase subunit SecA